MNERDRSVIRMSLISLDASSVTLALLLAYYLRISSGWLPYYGAPEPAFYSRMIAVGVAFWLIICASLHLYDVHMLFGGSQEYAQIAKACVLGVLMLAMVNYWVRDSPLSRAWLLLAWGFSTALMGIARFGFRRVVYRWRLRGRFVSRTLIVGASEEARAVAHRLSVAIEAGSQIVGFVDDALPPGTRVSGNLTVLGTPRNLRQLIEESDIHEIIIFPEALAWESFQEVILRAIEGLDNVTVKLSPGFYEIVTSNVSTSYRASVPLLVLDRARITGMDSVLKSLLDLSLSAVLFIAASSVIGLIAMVLWLSGVRPVFDRPLVMGMRGRPFRTCKFRTGLLGSIRRTLIRPLPEKLISQGAVSALGGFLFRTELDKLPQLLDVLRGRMSLVGPRTISIGAKQRYGRWLPSLLTVKPGITGPWAVNHVATLDDEIRLMVYYVRNWSIWLDLQVLYQTARYFLFRAADLESLREFVAHD